MKKEDWGCNFFFLEEKMPKKITEAKKETNRNPLRVA